MQIDLIKGNSMRAALFVLLYLFPSWLHAACAGVDLRMQLSPQKRAAIEATIADVPFRAGHHWIATRGDRRIHVIGTMHFNDPRMDDVIQTLSGVIEGADLLLLEATAQDQADLQVVLGKDPSLTLITEGPSLIERLPPESWADLSQTVTEAGIPPWMAAKMRPWFLAISLALPPCMRSQPDLKNGMDRRLEAIATESGLPTRSLEDPLEVIKLLNSEPLEAQIEQLQAAISMMGGTEDSMRTMIESYFDEDVLLYLALLKQDYLAETPLNQAKAQAIWDKSFDGLLDGRNRDWIPVIEGSSENTLVVAVGALHLPGETGILHLLQQQGYTLVRAKFN